MSRTKSLMQAEAEAMLAMMVMKRHRRSKQPASPVKIVDAKMRISGSQRNKPCLCGSGVKGKNCKCELFDR